MLECDTAGEERVPGPCPFSKDTSNIYLTVKFLLLQVGGYFEDKTPASDKVN